MNNCASWITCHDLWLKVKSCDLALSLVRLESIVFQLVAEPVVTTRVTSRGMATRGASDTQWSSSSGWQWHWRGWSRWPNDRETWWEDSGPSQWGQVDQAAGLSGHVEAVGGPGVASSLDTLDGMENLATDGQGSANAAGAPTTGADSQNPQRSALARWEADPWWNGQDPWQGEQSAHETSRRTSWPETDGWRGDASMHEAPWRSTWGSADTWRRDDQAIDRRSWNSWESGYKGDYSDPPTWPGWNHRKQWVISVRRWDRLTDHPVSRRADKILRALGWDMAADFEHLSESDLAGHGYLDLILKVIETKAGVRDGEERRMAFKRAMYQTGRRRDETLAQFAVRRLQDFSIATSHGINMPKDFQASLLKEGAGLSDQNVQNLTSLLHGQDSDPNEVARCLGLLDVSRSDRVTGLVLPDEDYLQTETFVTEEPDTMESGDDIASDDEKHILLELEKLELGEEQAMEVYMALDSTHRRRTWKQSKQFKQEARKDRGHFSKNVNGSTPQQGALGGPPGVRSNGPKPFRRRLNREQLKKVTKCRLCSKKGHWAEDCQLNKNKPGNVQAFAFLSGECAEQPGLCRGAHHLASFLSVAEVNSVLAQVLGDRWRQPDAVVDPVVYLTITSGQAIIDPGAAQDLIGKPAYEKLKEHLASHGLQPVVQQDSGGLRNPSGIGGSAKALFKALVPVSFGQKPGLLEMTVIDADIPPLVSVGFLDFLGTSLNLPKNKIVFEKLGITMSISKLPSGHRTIELCDWPGGAFPVPSNVKVNFGLEDGAFNLFADAVVPPPCVVKKELSVTWDVDVEHGIIQEESNQYHHHIHHCSRPSAVESSLVSARSDLATCFRSLQRQDMSDHQFLCDEEVKNSQTSMSRKSHVGNLGDCADCTSSCSLSLSGEKPPQFDQSHSSPGHGSLEFGSNMGQMASVHDTRLHVDRGVSLCLREAVGVRENQEEPEIRPQLQGAMDGRTGSLPPSSKQGGEARQQVCFLDSVSPMRCTPLIHESQHQGDKDGSQQLSRKDSKCCPHDAREQGLQGQGDGKRDGGVSIQQYSCAGCSTKRCTCSPRKFPTARLHGRPDELSGANLDRAILSERSTSTSYDSVGHCNEPAESGTVHDAGVSQQSEQCSTSGGGSRDGSHPPSDCNRYERGRDGPDHLWRPVGGHPCKSQLGRLATRAVMAAWMLGPVIPKGDVISWEHLSPQGQASWKKLGMDESYLVVPRSAGRGLHHGDGLRENYVTEKSFVLSEPFVSSDEQATKEHLVPVENYAIDECEVTQNVFDGLESNLAWEQVGFSRVEASRRVRGCPQEVQENARHRVWNGSFKPTPEYQTSRHFHDVVWSLVTDRDHGVVYSGNKLSTAWLELDEASLPRYQVHVWTMDGHCHPDVFCTPLRSTGKWFQLNKEGNPDPLGQFLAYPSSYRHVPEEQLDMLEITASGGKVRSGLCNLVGKKVPGKIAFAELFSPERISPHVRKLRLPMVEKTSFDKTEGWNVFSGADRQRFWTFLDQSQPSHLAMSPECKAYSPIMNINWERMDPEGAKRIKVEGKIMWDFSVSAAWEQKRRDRYFSIEHPAGATSWQTPEARELMDQPDVALITFDQCACGLQVHPSGLSEKATSFLTNNPWLAMSLCSRQCDGQHSHVRLEGGQLTKKAQVYPEALCRLVALSVEKMCRNLPVPSFLEAMNFPVVEEGETDMLPIQETIPEESQASTKITEKQKRLVRRVHVNTGHPNREQFLRMLKAAGTKEEVLKYVRDRFSCDHCNLQRGMAPRRRAQMPRTFAFNKIVALDVLYISFQEFRVPILNAVCVGSNLQVAVRLPIPTGLSGGTPTSHACWKGFVETWCRYLGIPEMVMSDPGNEFRGHFERGCEFYGIFQHLTHPDSPWENGKAERHGGWLKDRLDAEIRSGRGVLENLSDFDEYLAEICACKNRWYCREGFTPYQLVFGEQPRLPHDLLSDHITSQQGLRDVYEDPLQVDSAAGEFRRQFEVRQAARQRAMKQASHQAISKATKSAMHRVKNWAPGQWVYVFRRARAGNDLHPRDRWVGPGVVILSNNSTVYVGMRSRLWRCSVSQLRPALPAEILGKEVASDPGLRDLLHQVMSSSRVGAVAVDREGPPGPEHDLLPVHQGEGAGELSEVIPPLPTVGLDGGIPSGLPPPPGLEPPVPVPGGGGHRRMRENEHPAQPNPLRRRISDVSVEEPLLEPPPMEQDPLRLPTVPEEEDVDVTPFPETGAQEQHRSTTPDAEPETPLLPPQLETTSPSTSRPDETETPQLPPQLPQSPYPSPQSDEPEPDIPVLPLVSQARPLGTAREPRTTSRSPRRNTNRRTPAEMLPYMGGNRVAHQVAEIEPLTRGEESSSSSTSTENDVTISSGGLTLFARGVQEQRLEVDASEQEWSSYLAGGWSGSIYNYTLGKDDYEFEDGEWILMAKRNGEADVKTLPEDEKKMFRESDLAEWQSIVNTGAVVVHSGSAARELREKHSHRVLSSRMVRRKKPIPGIGKWKAKSRWCVHGHTDPDLGRLTTYSPTPATESIMLFLQASLNCGLRISFADVKNAFCQSRKLNRAAGRLFAEPCEGLQLAPGALIELIIPVYGLEDAPYEWRATVLDYLIKELNFVQNILEPCWLSRYDKRGHLEAQILVEVDDFIIAARSKDLNQLKTDLEKRFHFGKWEWDSAEYAGRNIKHCGDRIQIDQQKYIVENLHPIHLARGRRSEKQSSLSTAEFESLRSLVYKINWLARETRPEVSGTASILASRLPNATVNDIVIANKAVNHLRGTSTRPLTLWKFHPEEMSFIVVSDAGGVSMNGATAIDDIGLPSDATQGAFMVLAAESVPTGGQSIKASPITWRSSKLKRKVLSTFGGETQAMLQGVSEVDWLQILYRDAVFHNVQIREWRESLKPHAVLLRDNCNLHSRQQQCVVTDAKALYDCILKEHPSGKQDRKASLELAIIVRDLQQTRSTVRWVSHQKMLVDTMTKDDLDRGNGALLIFLRTGVMSFVPESEELILRKEDPDYRRRSNKACNERAQREMEHEMHSLCCSIFVEVRETLIGGNCESNAASLDLSDMVA